MPHLDWLHLRQQILSFRDARDWSQFHDPKNLAEAISIEAAELLEVFLWKRPDESRALDPDAKARATEELADLFIFLVYMSDTLGVDLLAEVEKKIAVNDRKYPVERSKGSARKYTEISE